MSDNEERELEAEDWGPRVSKGAESSGGDA